MFVEACHPIGASISFPTNAVFLCFRVDGGIIIDKPSVFIQRLFYCYIYVKKFAVYHATVSKITDIFNTGGAFAVRNRFDEFGCFRHCVK